MIDKIRKETSALVKKVDISSQLKLLNDITIDLSNYQYLEYSDYMIYIFDDKRLIKTLSKSSSNQTIALDYKKRVKKA